MAPRGTFEEHMTRLETIITELSSEQVELDGALRLFEEGVERLTAAAAALSDVEARVRALVERADGSFQLDDLRG